MAIRGVRCGDRKGLLRGNQFHPCAHTAGKVIEAGHALVDLLAAAGEGGMRETALLEWLGASTERIALLAHAGRHLVPTHIARELSLGDVRADFALLQVPRLSTGTPRLLLVECQGALPHSLFEKGNRKLLYWGRDFLDGFSQLVDWHFVGHHDSLNQTIATLINGCGRPIEVSFLLVVGLRRFSMDHLSQRRLIAWGQALAMGSNFRISRFDDIAHDALSWASDCAEWAGKPREGAEPRDDSSRTATEQLACARSNEAARAGRPQGRSGAGAGT